MGGGGLSERDQQLVERTRETLRQLQDEFGAYRKQKGDKERSERLAVFVDYFVFVLSMASFNLFVSFAIDVVV